MKPFQSFKNLVSGAKILFRHAGVYAHAEQEGGTMEEKEQRDVDDMIYVDEWRESQR